MNYLVFTLFLSSALCHKDYNGNPEAGKIEKGDNCVDMSHYLDVEYNVTETTLCAFKQRTHCETQSSEVCRDIPVTSCRVVGFTECEETQETHRVRDDKLEHEVFTYQECSQVKKTVTETKKVPHCELVTQQQCDSKWVMNEYGEKMFATNENCRNVTWEDCKLLEKPVEKEVDSYECHPASEGGIRYPTVVEDTQEVTTVDRVCQPRVENVCEVHTEQQCETVEWEQCRDTVQPHCFDFKIRTPHQEYNHLLRCIDH